MLGRTCLHGVHRDTRRVRARALLALPPPASALGRTRSIELLCFHGRRVVGGRGRVARKAAAPSQVAHRHEHARDVEGEHATDRDDEEAASGREEEGAALAPSIEMADEAMEPVSQARRGRGRMKVISHSQVDDLD